MFAVALSWPFTGNKKRTVSIRVEAGCPCVTTSAWTTDGFHIPGRSCEHAHVRGQTAVPVAYVVLQRQVVERPCGGSLRSFPWCAGTTPSSDRGCRRAEAADEQSWQWASRGSLTAGVRWCTNTAVLCARVDCGVARVDCESSLCTSELD